MTIQIKMNVVRRKILLALFWIRSKTYNLYKRVSTKKVKVPKKDKYNLSKTTVHQLNKPDEQTYISQSEAFVRARSTTVQYLIDVAALAFLISAVLELFK